MSVIGDPTGAAGDTWHWADQLKENALRRMAEVTLALLTQPERWIHRRTERIAFLDHKSAHHHVSVDFTLPTGVPPIGEFRGNEVYVAPLFLLAKDAAAPLLVDGKPVPTAPFSHITLSNETGCRLPLLTRRQSGRLAAVVLQEAATATLERALPPLLKDSINDVALEDKARRVAGLDYIFSDEIGPRDLRQTLRDEPLFRDLAFALATHSVIVSLFTDGVPGRSIVELGYNEPFAGNASPWWTRWFRSFGWMPQQYFIALNEIGASTSYHIELDVPRELELNETGLYGTRYEDFGRDPRSLPRRKLPYYIREPQSASEGNIYVPEPHPGRRVGAVWVKLRVRRPGFLRSALAASVVTSCVLFVMWGLASRFEGAAREPTVALLLLVPAVLVVWVARADEHPITTRLLTWARIMLMVDAVLPFVAALILVTTPTSEASTPSRPSVIVSGAGMLTVPMAQAEVQAAQTEARREADIASLEQQRDVHRLSLYWGVLTLASLIVVLQFAATMRWPHPGGKPRYSPFPRTV